jgi:hypothetical protein
LYPPKFPENDPEPSSLKLATIPGLYPLPPEKVLLE